MLITGSQCKRCSQNSIFLDWASGLPSHRSSRRSPTTGQLVIGNIQLFLSLPDRVLEPHVVSIHHTAVPSNRIHGTRSLGSITLALTGNHTHRPWAAGAG